MLTDVGEFIVGAYLQIVEECDIVDYNVRPPGGGLEGLGELDVIGLNFETDTIYFCEVSTHIRGFKGKKGLSRLRKKHDRQIKFAKQYQDNFPNQKFMFWSPYVPRGNVTEALSKITTLELIINGEYKSRFDKLHLAAKNQTHDARNPVFRILQIMENLKDWPVE